MRIGVTGASGALASAAVRLLAAAGHEVVALTRTPGSCPAPDGVTVRRADFDEPAGLPAAFAGVDRLLLVSTDAWEPGRRIAQHTAAIDAARDAGVRHLVYTSLVACDGPPDMLHRAHRATEAHLRATAPRWTILRDAVYAEGIPGLLAGARTTGRYVTNTGDGAVAYVRRDDCAATAAAALVRTGDLHGRVLDVTGPRALTAGDLAALAGPEVTAVHVSDDGYRAHLIAGGTPPPVADALVELGRAIRSGRYATVTTTVPDLTGRPATEAGRPDGG
ncbi:MULTISPECIES: NAD(P)H-binding protein [Catenuloplanes]|uniref:NAD(P)H dehydrogenase (Quinone) n=1 Tax=Catenuloplanes niger TaxID=587534 RepID=A0AAE3ZSX8_9ACTN|nr:NAD(P)H-binding protein [Catenuloplanes niger]MDR7325503.1 NAD(P)H dehydrogenase (quinone) [Catenuloplanes niger]